MIPIQTQSGNQLYLERTMTTGITRLFISLALLLLCHALLLMTRETPLGQLVGGWAALALLASAVSGLWTGLSGARALSRFLESCRKNPND